MSAKPCCVKTLLQSCLKTQVPGLFCTYVSCNHPRLSSAQVTERRLQEQEEQERQREEEEEERSLRQRCEELVRQEAKRMAERGYRSRVGSSAQINTSP